MTTTAPTTSTPTATSAVIPFLRYDDARAAINWLVAALGFEQTAVFDSPDGTVGHAELRFGDSFIMLGTSKEDALAIRSPRRLGGSNQGICLVVDDPDAHHARAAGAGADVVQPLADTSYGSRAYTCRDSEGNLWTVGTYRPPGGASLAPCLQLADARGTIAWLAEAFGLTPGLVVPGPGERVTHAELHAGGGGVVMVGSHADNEVGLTTARRLGAVSQGIYVVVPDAEAHHRRAAAAGASIVLGLKNTDYGSREYTCRDLEGNLWSFGTYHP
jgi:uncharacterized glyoxalase superfamily protein PhnB